jgi:LmbE family N-acetylglucosaminyl deacetylase
MRCVYVLAHFDDEYFAWPLILRRAQAGWDQRFFYVADYATPALAARRLAESRALLASLGIGAEQVVHVGAGAGALDGSLHLSAPAALDSLTTALDAAGPIDRLAVMAWEGGHPDHDICAALALRLAARLGGLPVDQFSLYNGPGLPGRLFRAGDPLPQNGPAERLKLSPAEWLAYGLGVRFFPSQARTWLGLWPAMFASFLLRGFRYQTLAPERVEERPHPGPLLYERMFGVAYEAVRAGLSAAPAGRDRA